MKHTSIKVAQMRLMATLLLIWGTVTAHAQYYMNIRQDDGTRLRYFVSAVDSIWFDNDEHEYVDLGLSVNWATFNVGAEKPEDYGDYYAWGETETKSNYAFENYRFRISGSSYDNVKFSKYNTKSDRGTVDNKTTLDLSDDVAYVKWGDNWRMPTQAELAELNNTDNCTWTWTTQNGVKGFLVTSKKSGYEGASIFLPAAGCRYDTTLGLVGTDGLYLSSSLDTNRLYCACYLGFYSVSHFMSSNVRSYGFSVRPVWPYSIAMKLDTDSLSLNPDDETTLTAVVKRDGQVMDYKVQWSSDNLEVATVSADGVVKGLSEGTALITAEYCGHTATCLVTVVKPEKTGYEYVDLGLSVKWATCNVGATAPEEYGDYFAWGETEPYYEAGYAQENPQAHWKNGYSAGYGWSTYKYCKGSEDTMTKYCGNSSFGYNGFTDTLTILLSDDDVARVKWGGNWRMPTIEEFDELQNNCDWKWTTLNGVTGFQVISRKDSSCSIFLPAAGYYGTTGLNGLGNFGDYWSSSTDTDWPIYPWRLSFELGNHYKSGLQRYLGQSVRPVCP